MISVSYFFCFEEESGPLDHGWFNSNKSFTAFVLAEQLFGVLSDFLLHSLQSFYPFRIAIKASRISCCAVLYSFVMSSKGTGSSSTSGHLLVSTGWSAAFKHSWFLFWIFFFKLDKTPLERTALHNNITHIFYPKKAINRITLRTKSLCLWQKMSSYSGWE